MEKRTESLVSIDRWLTKEANMNLVDAPFDGKEQALANIPQLAYRELIYELGNVNGPIHYSVYSLNSGSAGQKTMYVDLVDKETDELQSLQIPGENEQNVHIPTKFVNALITFIYDGLTEAEKNENSGGDQMVMNFFKKTKAFESNQEQTAENGQDLFVKAQVQQAQQEEVQATATVPQETAFPTFGEAAASAPYTAGQEQFAAEKGYPTLAESILLSDKAGFASQEEQAQSFSAQPQPVENVASDEEKSLLTITEELESRVVEQPIVKEVPVVEEIIEEPVEQVEPQLDLNKSILIGMPIGYEEVAAARPAHLQIDFTQLNDELTEVYKFVKGVEERATLKKLKADLWELELAEDGPTNEQALSILDDILSLQFTEALLLQWQLKTIRQFYIFMK